MKFSLFPFVDHSNPFHERIEVLREIIDGSPELEALAAERNNAPYQIHAEIKVAHNGDGKPAFDRFYWSCQISGLHGFRAVTLTMDRKSDEAKWHCYPSDHYLPGLAAFDPSSRSISVLRYVPLRRFTFLESDGDRRRIGKFKRRSRYRAAYNRLSTSHRLCSTSDASFSVAAPAGIVDDLALYYQEHLPGENVADMVGDDPLILATVGSVHRQLHTFDGQDLPLLANETYSAEADSNAKLISFYFPDLTTAIANATSLIHGWIPCDQNSAFAHGDFVCSQLLSHKGHISIIDFDLCCQTDPYREIAMFAASMPFDIMALGPSSDRSEELWRKTIETCEETYLAGYEDRLGTQLDPRRLAWHRACAELYYLALMLKKDRYESIMAKLRLERLARCLEVIG